MNQMADDSINQMTDDRSNEKADIRKVWTLPKTAHHINGGQALGRNR
jgi:hypothetical protein